MGARAELVVIGGAQQCSTMIMNEESNTAVLEFDYVSNDCLIDYKGNLVPHMLWYGPEPFDQRQVTTTPQVWNGMQIIQVSRSMDQSSWRSVVNFTGPINVTSEYKTAKATNVPEFEMTYTTPTINVHWPPAILRIQGVKPGDEYYPGDKLECVVDSNPTAVVQWTNLRTMQSTEGTMLTVDPAWSGETQEMRCEASNVINSVLQPNRPYLTNITITVGVIMLETSSTTATAMTDHPSTAKPPTTTFQPSATNPQATTTVAPPPATSNFLFAFVTFVFVFVLICFTMLSIGFVMLLRRERQSVKKPTEQFDDIVVKQ
jgi:hypothetical protein